MIQIAVMMFLASITMMVSQRIRENEPSGVSPNVNLLPPNVFSKFQEYMNNFTDIKNVQVVSWNESTNILEYDDGKMIYTLKLEKDGFHRIRG